MRKKILSLILITYLMTAFTGCSKTSDNQVSLRDQGIALMETGDYEGAVELFNQALALSKGKVTDLELDIDYYKAAALYEAKQYDDAINLYTALIRFDDENSMAFFLRGCIYADTEQISLACEDYDSAIAVNKKDYELYIEIYENLTSLGYSDQASEYLNQLLDMSDNSAEAKYFKGRGYYLIQEYDTAEELLKAAVDKDIVDAKLYLAKLYQDQGDTDKAKTLLDEYANSDGVNGEAMAALGDIEISKGNYEDALEYYETGLSLDTVDNAAALYKGQVVALENLGRFDEAANILEEYVDQYPGDEEAANELTFLKTR